MFDQAATCFLAPSETSSQRNCTATPGRDSAAGGGDSVRYLWDRFDIGRPKASTWSAKGPKSDRVRRLRRLALQAIHETISPRAYDNLTERPHPRASVAAL